MNRNQNSLALQNKDGKWYFGVTRYPKIPYSSDDIYLTTTIGDRLDQLADRYYPDSSYYIIIAIANPQIPKDSLNIPPGTQIRIPMNYQKFLIDLKNINSI